MTSPDLALLTGPDVGDLLAAALATTGEELVDWRVRQVDHRPGAATTALFEATVRRGDATERQTFGASVGLARADDHPGVLQLSDGDRNVAVWRFPHDPGLPGLASAGDPQQMRLLLESLGGPALTAEEIRIRVRAYRPRRRAVVQVTAPGAGFFVKALRPDRVEDVHRRHVLLHGAGVPVPRSLGWTDSGLLVLEPLPGTPMRSALWSATAPLPGADELVGVLDRLPEEVLDLPRRAAWSEHAEHYAALVGAALPEEAPRAASLGERIASAIEGAPATEPTHGDFYEAQLLLSHGRITGLLDVDTVGPGRRADDLACALAHVEVLALMYTAHRPRLRALSQQWRRTMEELVDPDELHARVAGVLLSLATGPHRVQDVNWREATTARLDLVERWLEPAPERRDRSVREAR